MSTKRANELKFKHWKETKSGGRLYRREVKGKGDWRAMYYKEVDSNENTLRFWQEIYDSSNVLLKSMRNSLRIRGTKK